MADNLRIDELRRRVEKDPASIAFAQLAEEYRRSGDYAEAARVCRAGLARHPSYLSARVTLGRALIELKQYEGAQTELDYVLKSAPENLAAIRGLAEIHQRRGELNAALRRYQSALVIAKHDPELEESVHDLTRQLGGPMPETSGTEPPPIPFDMAAGGAPMDDFSSAGTSSAKTLASLSPELEAAADEFTKALQALDALTLDLPTPSLPDTTHTSYDPPEDVPVSHVEDEEERFDVAPPLPPPPLPESQPVEPARDTSDDAVVNELEEWLDAIVRDRAVRAQGGQGDTAGRAKMASAVVAPAGVAPAKASPDLPDLPVSSR